VHKHFSLPVFSGLLTIIPCYACKSLCNFLRLSIQNGRSHPLRPFCAQGYVIGKSAAAIAAPAAVAAAVGVVATAAADDNDNEQDPQAPTATKAIVATHKEVPPG
jgi:hypothetical protein